MTDSLQNGKFDTSVIAEIFLDFINIDLNLMQLKGYSDKNPLPALIKKINETVQLSSGGTAEKVVEMNAELEMLTKEFNTLMNETIGFIKYAAETHKDVDKSVASHILNVLK